MKVLVYDEQEGGNKETRCFSVEDCFKRKVAI